MNIVNTLPTKTAEIHKLTKLYEVRLYALQQYTETFYSPKKREIKPHLKKLGYSLTIDFTKISAKKK